MNRVQVELHWRSNTWACLLSHKHFGTAYMLGDVAQRLVRIILLLFDLHGVSVVWKNETKHAREYDSGVEFL